MFGLAFHLSCQCRLLFGCTSHFTGAVINNIHVFQGSGEGLAGFVGHGGSLFTGGAALADDVDHHPGFRLQFLNHGVDTAGGIVGALGQAPDLVRHHRKASARLAGPCGFNRSIQGQKIGLLGNVADNFQHHADGIAAFGQSIHLVVSAG